MQSATNVKIGRREDRSLLCVPCPCLENSLFYNFPVFLTSVFASQVLELILSPMFSALDATTASDGSTTKRLILRRNTRKVSSVLVLQLLLLLSLLSSELLLWEYRKIPFGTREAGEGECLEVGRQFDLFNVTQLCKNVCWKFPIQRTCRHGPSDAPPIE